MYEPGPWDAFIRAELAVWSQPGAMELAAAVRPGQIGCATCKYVGKAAEFTGPRRRLIWRHIELPSPRLCPRCGVDVGSQGMADGDELYPQLSAFRDHR